MGDIEKLKKIEDDKKKEENKLSEKLGPYLGHIEILQLREKGTTSRPFPYINSLKEKINTNKGILEGLELLKEKEIDKLRKIFDKETRSALKTYKTRTINFFNRIVRYNGYVNMNTTYITILDKSLGFVEDNKITKDILDKIGDDIPTGKYILNNSNLLSKYGNIVKVKSGAYTKMMNLIDSYQKNYDIVKFVTNQILNTSSYQTAINYDRFKVEWYKHLKTLYNTDVKLNKLGFWKEDYEDILLQNKSDPEIRKALFYDTESEALAIDSYLDAEYDRKYNTIPIKEFNSKMYIRYLELLDMQTEIYNKLKNEDKRMILFSLNFAKSWWDNVIGLNIPKNELKGSYRDKVYSFYDFYSELKIMQFFEQSEKDLDDIISNSKYDLYAILGKWWKDNYGNYRTITGDDPGNSSCLDKFIDIVIAYKFLIQDYSKISIMTENEINDWWTENGGSFSNKQIFKNSIIQLFNKSTLLLGLDQITSYVIGLLRNPTTASKLDFNRIKSVIFFLMKKMICDNDVTTDREYVKKVTEYITDYDDKIRKAAALASTATAPSTTTTSPTVTTTISVPAIVTSIAMPGIPIPSLASASAPAILDKLDKEAKAEEIRKRRIN